MGTLFVDIYDKFLSSIEDEKLLSLPEETIESYLESFLTKAVAIDFTYCNSELSYDDTSKSFDIELTQREQWIIATYMSLYWLQKQINSEKGHRMLIGSKDMKFYSPSERMKTLLTTELQMTQKLNKYKQEYIYESDAFTGFGGE